MISTGFSILLLYWYEQIVVYLCPCNSCIFNISSVFVCRFVLNNQLNVAGSCSKSLIYFMKVMTWNWCSLLFTFCLSSNNMILSLDRRGNFFWKGVDLVLPESQYLRCVQQAKSEFSFILLNYIFPFRILLYSICQYAHLVQTNRLSKNNLIGYCEINILDYLALVSSLLIEHLLLYCWSG